MLLCYLLGRSTNTIESNIKSLFEASTEEVLETNAKMVYIHSDLLYDADGYNKETRRRSLCT